VPIQPAAHEPQAHEDHNNLSLLEL
jgi:hypothetical protein